MSNDTVKWLLEQKDHADMAAHLSGLLVDLTFEMVGRSNEVGAPNTDPVEMRRMAKNVQKLAKSYANILSDAACRSAK